MSFRKRCGLVKMAGHPRFYELLELMKETHDKKNSDYSDDEDPFSNFRECEKFGIPAYKGALVRMSDKWSRIINLINKGGKHKVKDESITDTLIDLANYALITTILIEEAKQDGKF